MKLVKLKDISIGQGNYGIGAAAVDYNNDLYKYLRITDIHEDGTVDENELKSVDDINAKDYLLKENDICFARTGNSTGKTYFYDGTIKDLVYAGFLIKFSLDNNKVNPKYIKYYTLSNKYKNWVKEIQTGSTRGNINAKMYGELEIELPEREYQDKAVELLETITKRIELNKHTNNNLYKILDNIFKEKYLNNERYNLWEEVTLDDITSKFATGLNPRKNFVLGHGSNYYVTIKNMQNNDVILNDKCDKVDDEAILKINKRSDLKVGDLLFSGIGTIGRVYLIKDVPYNWNISESIFTIRPNEKCSSEFLYLLLLNKNMQNYAVNKASGSVQKGIRMADLKQFKVKLPTYNEMQSFTDVIKPIIDRIYNKTKQNEKLELIRETLLPKLMNGEIDLDKIEI